MDERPSRWEVIKEKISTIDPIKLVVIFVAFLIVAGAIIGLLNYRKKQEPVAEPPKLEVTEPSGGTPTESDKTTIQGSTNPGSSVTINGNQAKIGSDGRFSEEVSLKPGENKIEIIATNESGYISRTEFTVTRNEVTTIPNGGPAVVDGSGNNLSKSGPETFWLLESSALSLAGAGWFFSRKKLGEVQKKN